MPEPLDKATPIKHLVVIFQENPSFDGYFGVYPTALNPPGQPAFRRPARHAFGQRPDRDAAGAQSELVQPVPDRSARSYTCDQDHDYTAEQSARNGGLMDQFVASTLGAAGQRAASSAINASMATCDTVMGYFDGNTVTALWNYAQHFALSDNFFATMSGQSTRGALNLVAGDVFGAVCRPVNPSPPGATIVFVDDGGTVPECDGPVDSTTTPRPPTARSARSSTTPIRSGTSARKSRARWRSRAATSAIC